MDEVTSLMRRYPGVEFVQGEIIALGDRVSIDSGTRIVAGVPVEIGHDTMIAARVIITTNTHDPNDHPMWKRCISRPISIGCHVWIGVGAIILPGVRIGDGAVIAAGTVVNRHVPAWTVVGGNPARIIRARTKGSLEPGGGYPGVGVAMGFLPDDAICPNRNDLVNFNDHMGA